MPSVFEVRPIIDAFDQIVALASVSLSSGQVRGEFIAAPHRRPTSLPPGTQAVYAFFLGEFCLKVGKAGPKTQARFTSQHYSPSSAPSTLAKSILLNKDRLAAILPLSQQDELSGLDNVTVGLWMERNTSRLHIYLASSVGEAALSLLEAFLQCWLKPMFEGKTA